MVALSRPDRITPNLLEWPASAKPACGWKPVRHCDGDCHLAQASIPIWPLHLPRKTGQISLAIFIPPKRTKPTTI
jgi:hypothetical protein